MVALSKIFKFRLREDKDFFRNMVCLLGFKPNNISYYKKAFTHRSANVRDKQGFLSNYERLEFLGDAILSAVVSSYLFNEIPHGDEGHLTKMRSKVVSRENLNNLGKKLGLIDHITSKINKSNFGDNIYGNIFEALIGAVYLDKGYATSVSFIQKKVIKKHINIKELEEKIISYKSLIIEWCQKKKRLFGTKLSKTQEKIFQSILEQNCISITK